ncbi:kinase-like domain-containing protein [Aspergillus alliaceus]|uniref:Kinase-like domain-containing protein n=1 Tax=Petromyces alliaceus TaxID=209559 RepID=A0A5N7BRB2_PETAA|nr:kinase-like domain-containing protein [Aspergillus alliaceus]
MDGFLSCSAGCQCLRGQNGLYTIAKKLRDTVWLARDGRQQPVIVKSVHHFRLQNERDVLKRFQHHTPFIRPLVDEITEPSDPPAIVLKHLDYHLLNASISQRLTGQEIKICCERYFADVKPDNILINYGPGDIRFKDVQLADCGSTVPADSAYALDGDLIGAPIWRSPEAHLRIRWGTATDIWSFGALLITLLYGDNFSLFKPNVPRDHDEYEIKILQRQCEFFGSFPLVYRELCPYETLNVLAEDKEFILKIMKLDPRDRPSAAELLQDKWFDIK